MRFVYIEDAESGRPMLVNCAAIGAIIPGPVESHICSVLIQGKGYIVRGTAEQVLERVNASEERKAAEVDGDGGTPAGEGGEEEPRSAVHEPPAVARVRGKQRKG